MILHIHTLKSHHLFVIMVLSYGEKERAIVRIEEKGTATEIS